MTLIDVDDDALVRVFKASSLVGATLASGPAPSVVLSAGPGAPAASVVLDDAGALRQLQAWARRDDHVLAFEDAKPALRALLAHGVDVRRPLCLKTLARLARPDEADEERAPPPSPAEARDRVDRALDDVDAALRAVEESGQRKVARLECLVLPAFAAMEHRGLAVDVPAWRALVDDARARATAARAEVMSALGGAVDRDLFGEPLLSLESDADVKQTLERALSRPLVDVGKHTLAALDHPAARALLAFRDAHKVVTTYGDAFLARVDARTGRLHATFIPLGASTGRVASRDPNLQNLPSERAFHEALRAPPGRALVTADYAACELRILADLAGDEVFLAAFARGEDLHATVAQTIFKVPVSKTENPELRARAKAINFGLMYGMGAPALAAATSSSVDEAERLLAAYFAAFPRIKRYLEDSVDRALARGYAETVLGRRLTFDRAVVESPNARGELSRIARNMPIQGTSADMTKLAMVLVHERLAARFDDAGLVNTIHDELVVECAQDDGAAVADVVRGSMEDAHRTLLSAVPPEVEVHVGPHWAH